jgi:hypothetical protein
MGLSNKAQGVKKKAHQKGLKVLTGDYLNSPY